MKQYKVVDNEFNQANYPELIGKRYTSPPSYARVKEIVVLEPGLHQLIDGSFARLDFTLIAD